MGSSVVIGRVIFELDLEFCCDCLSGRMLKCKRE